MTVFFLREKVKMLSEEFDMAISESEFAGVIIFFLERKYRVLKGQGK